MRHDRAPARWRAADARLIQLHSDDPQTVFSLARQQERELREWLYQERTTSDRSVSAGLKAIAAQTEDEHGKPIEVVTVGDARPSAQTDALLDATQQALINAVTHGGEPISVYCEPAPTRLRSSCAIMAMGST